MHAGAVQRKSRLYRPGLTKAETSSRVSPLAMTVRHRRQRARPDGATLKRYVLCFCLKPLLLTGAGCGCGGTGVGAGTAFFLRQRFTRRSQSSGSKINEESYIGGHTAVCALGVWSVNVHYAPLFLAGGCGAFMYIETFPFHRCVSLPRALEAHNSRARRPRSGRPRVRHAAWHTLSSGAGARARAGLYIRHTQGARSEAAVQVWPAGFAAGFK